MQLMQNLILQILLKTLSSFDSDGFTVGPDKSEEILMVIVKYLCSMAMEMLMVELQHLMTASATGITTDSVIQANTEAGFSIVTYSGTGQ
jgi:hypothetical protein